eukprot:scaffold5974_cov158-Ochromonas_danica.AAC.11
MDLDTSTPRSGKWTAEEENFAFRLIRDFESGVLLDCEDGCTLRSYLARKLNCAPMRISKKFAGKCIGKHTFTRKPGALQGSVGGAISESLWIDNKEEFLRRKTPRMSFRAHSPQDNQFYDDSDDSMRSPDFTNEEYSFADNDCKPSFYTQPYGGNSFARLDSAKGYPFGTYDHFSNLGTDLAESEGPANFETDEWRDVLAYFWGPEEMQVVSNAMTRNISYASLFTE